MSIALTIECDNPDLLVGIVEASDVRRGEADTALSMEIAAALHDRDGIASPPDADRSAIRDLLRRGGYKPTGRGKPASEYLAQAAARGEFPRISHVVDALNLTSLESGLPISLLDADRAMAGATGLVVRLGMAGEKYVFNDAGHEIDLEGLLCVARKDGPPLGNAVKDGMATKTTPETANVLAVIWGSARMTNPTDLGLLCEKLALRLRAGEATTRVVHPPRA
jgi:DNA/RNA-binding domain of Phe-tRNA-synthetase-like protein